MGIEDKEKKTSQPTEEEVKNPDQIFDVHLPAGHGGVMWQDPLGMDKSHPLAETWKGVIDFNENIEALAQKNAVNEEMREAGRNVLREVLDRIDMNKVLEVPYAYNFHKGAKRNAIAIHSAYCLMINYSEVADMLGLQEEKNEFLKNALKTDLLKETEYDYEKIIQDEIGESLAMEAMMTISDGLIKTMAKADGRNIESDIFSKTFTDKRYLRELHTPGKKYIEEDMQRYNLPESMLKEAVNELIRHMLTSERSRGYFIILREYEKYVDHTDDLKEAIEKRLKNRVYGERAIEEYNTMREKAAGGQTIHKTE